MKSTFCGLNDVLFRSRACSRLDARARRRGPRGARGGTAWRRRNMTRAVCAIPGTKKVVAGGHGTGASRQEETCDLGLISTRDPAVSSTSAPAPRGNQSKQRERRYQSPDVRTYKPCQSDIIRYKSTLYHRGQRRRLRDYVDPRGRSASRRGAARGRRPTRRRGRRSTRSRRQRAGRLGRHERAARTRVERIRARPLSGRHPRRDAP